MTRQLIAGSLAAAAAMAMSGMASAATPLSQAVAVPGTQSVSFSVYLPLRNTAAMQALLKAQQTKGSPSYHQWLTPAQAAAQFGPTQATMAQAQTALTAAGFQVTKTHLFSIDATGPASAANQVFQTTLRSIAASGGTTRIIASGHVTVPQSLSALGATVPSFANVPEHHSMGHLLGASPANRTSPVGGYNYDDLKQAYDYPSYLSLDGTGANVAIVMEASAQNSDVASMFNTEGFTTTTGKSPPTFTYVAAGTCFGPPPTDTPYACGGSYGGVGDGGTDEAELDIQMVLGGAPGANVSQLSIPNLSDFEIMSAYNIVIDSGAFDIVSNSFGECELFYTPAYNDGYDFTGTLALYSEYYAFGNLEGTTWFVSSGDEGGPGCPSVNIVPYFYGSTGGPEPHFIKGVSTPASDPYVTAVGGGNLLTSYKAGSLQSTYVSEQGFGDPEIPYDEFGVGEDITGGYWGAGGGVSTVFAQPSYQTGLTLSAAGRNVPDIGMLVGGCPGGISQRPCGPDRAYVNVTIGGVQYGFIGTSVSSPELAGATALAVEYYGGRLGNINPVLYSLGATQIAQGGANAPAAYQYFHMNINGFDGAYTATANKGYNYIYGNGSPDVRVLFGLTSLPAAGTPQTASNP